MKKPRVTLVIPVYKGKQYMKEAIDSALAQTYENLEILVINDGSPDDGATDKIARSYGDKIKYIFKENGGVSTVLNLAIKEMSGEYFSWLSHDDVYYSEKIEENINYLVENKLIGEDVILYSDYDLIDKNSKFISREIKDHRLLTEKPEYAMLKGAVNGITLLIPKKAFIDCGNFDEKLLCAQDYDMWYRMMQKGYKFVHQPKVLAKTRLHRNQDTNTNPKVVTEGNNFWINMIDDIPLETKIRLEGSEYNYYKEMTRFLKTTPYNMAENYCRNKYKEIETMAKDRINGIKVSIILPLYNSVSLVDKTLESIINQTHKNYEILLINDGSIDNIKSIKDKVKKNKQIKVIDTKPKNNIFNARNVGIENADGKYIAFVDAGDIFDFSKLEIQLLKMIVENAKISHTSYNCIIKGELTCVKSGVQSNNVIPSIIGKTRSSLSTIMVDKEYLNKNAHKFDVKQDKYVYTYFLLKILAKEKMLGIDKALTTTIGEVVKYDYNLQIDEMQKVLEFVLNDHEFQNRDYEIGLISNYYINIINKVNKTKKIKATSLNSNCPNCIAITNSLSWKITKPLRITKKVLIALKKEGIKGTLRKIKNAIRK